MESSAKSQSGCGKMGRQKVGHVGGQTLHGGGTVESGQKSGAARALLDCEIEGGQIS